MSARTAPAPTGLEAGTGGEAHLALEITGMTCASCVRRVERALAAVSGVVAAVVNLAAEARGAGYFPGCRPASASARPGPSSRDF